MNTLLNKAMAKTEKINSVIKHINANLSKKIIDNSHLDKASWKLSNEDKFEGHEGKAWSEGWDKGWSKWGK